MTRPTVLDGNPKFEQGTPLRNLLAELDSALRAIDPSVNQTVGETSIKYSWARRTFATVRPHSGCLAVELHLPFYALSDPQHKGRHRPHVPSVTVKLRTPKDVPYIAGLARQSFDWQRLDGTESAALG